MTGCASLGAAPACSRSDDPTLDQLLAEPIVQQLMRRDRVYEATIRHLVQEIASARRASLKLIAAFHPLETYRLDTN